MVVVVQEVAMTVLFSEVDAMERVEWERRTRVAALEYT